MTNLFTTFLHRLLNREQLHRIEQQNLEILDHIIIIHSILVALTEDEFSPQRNETSAKLGNMACKRMIAEEKARKHTTGEL